jgi:hypothetical protein
MYVPHLNTFLSQEVHKVEKFTMQWTVYTHLIHFSLQNLKQFLVRNEEVLQRIKGERNIPQTIKRRQANWMCHVLWRKYLLKHLIEVKKGG